MIKNRPYIYYDQAVSLCETCMRRIEAKLVIADNRVWMHKWCQTHGHSKVLIASDAAYWRLGREIYVKPPEMPQRFNTDMQWGCPYDCGLCPDHMQHSCLSIIEITDHCNLSCPVCYAESSPQRTGHLDIEIIERMLDTIVANEGQPDVVQISGGEPTMHPNILEILAAAKRRPIRHLMLNTNGLRIANEPGFAEKLAAFSPGFEIYLQFDSLRRDALVALRGADLRRVRERALERLNAVGLSCTLVVTVARGINDAEIGEIVDFAATQPCVRGVTLQPVQFAGRTEGIRAKEERLTLTEVRDRILAQTSLFAAEDIIPVPCNPDALAMGYAIKTADGIRPLTRFIAPEMLLAGNLNTISFETDAALKAEVFKVFSTNLGPEDQADCLASLLCCLPKVEAPKEITYDKVFRVLIMTFLDAINFDLRAMKKSCVHIVRPDGTLVPFESFNLLYRNERSTVLAERRKEVAMLFKKTAAGDSRLCHSEEKDKL